MAAEASSSSKRKRKSNLPTEKLPPQSPASKSRSHRVFSPDDSLNLLKTFHEILKDSPSPATAATLLFNRIGKSLSGEISQTQMIEKLRKLRQKYSKQVEDVPEFKTANEFEIYSISNKIWGENPVKRNSSSSPKKPSVQNGNKKKEEEPKKPIASGVDGNKKKEEEPKKPITSDVEIGPVPVIPEAKGVDLSKKYSFLMEEAAQFPGNYVMNEGLKRLDETELGRLNNRWKLQQIKEAEMLVKKTELIQEQTKLILEAFQN